MVRLRSAVLALGLVGCSPGSVSAPACDGVCADLTDSWKQDGPRGDGSMPLDGGADRAQPEAGQVADCGGACAADARRLEAASCQPACAGKACGPDGCGGFCGNGSAATLGCPAGQSCASGACILPPPKYDLTPGTYSGAAVTAALQGKATFAWQPGSYTVTSEFFIPSNITITATGASIKLTGGSIKNAAPTSCGVVGDNHYTHAGGFTWDGGTLYRDAGDTLMSFAHAPSLTIKNATFYRYCSSTNSGHAIEINACGGPNLGTNPAAGTGPYTVRIVNNAFLGTDQGQRTNSNDEPIQYDWAYSTAAAGAKVCPNQSNVLASTMCHNVEISGNTFYRYATTGSWASALCAIGGHKPADPISGTKRLPTNRHNNFLIANNQLHEAIGSTGTNPDKGAIHLFALRGVTVSGNAFHLCTPSRLVSYEIDGNAPGEVETTDLPYITSQVPPVHANN